MEKRYFKFGCFVVFIVMSVVFVLSYYLASKTYYLNIEFSTISGDLAKVAKIELSEGISLKGVSVDDLTGITEINDEKTINVLINYLNSIPLSLSEEKDLPVISDGKSGTILFYSKDGRELGWITIEGEIYIQRSTDLKVFKVRNDVHIISELEKIV